MAVPKKLKKSLELPLVDPYGGPKKYMTDYKSENKGPVPRSIDFTDLDAGFVEWANKEFNFSVDGEKVPITFLTAQRWAEFTRTWESTDKYKNMKIPFVSIVRKPDAQPGTNPSDFKIPVRKPFTYSLVPKWDGHKKGFDVYKIPQPVGVDLTYTVRFFTFRMNELNTLNEKILTIFTSAQSYTNIKGHYFPIMLESVGDESVIDSLDEKRFYVQTYEIKMMAYILNAEEFTVEPAVERAIVNFEVNEKRPKVVKKFIKQSEEVTLAVFQFLPGSPTSITFQNDGPASYISVDTVNVTAASFRVNGSLVTFPFFINQDDIVSISIVRTESTEISELIVRGTIPN
jgi:hypothetical protein